jgi:hypothetical protein
LIIPEDPTFPVTRPMSQSKFISKGHERSAAAMCIELPDAMTDCRAEGELMLRVSGSNIDMQPNACGMGWAMWEEFLLMAGLNIALPANPSD